MPDRGGVRALHRLCDSVSGANWRPTRFEDELTLIRYACCVCHVIPSTTVLLPCSHALCELCLKGCIVQDGGSVCPLDAQPFREDECQKLKLPEKTKHSLKAHCWNEADGCQFVGNIQDVVLHFDRECGFHALQCPRCERRILRTDIAAHYVSGCCHNASCASSGQPNRQDSASTSCCDNAILEKLSALQSQMNELCRSPDSARLDEISREIKGVKSNIISMVTRRLNAGLEQVKRLIRDPESDQMSSLQSQMNELVEQSRQHNTSEMQEMVRMLRDSRTELQQHVKAQSMLMAHMLRNSESKFTDLIAQLQEFVDVINDSGRQMKEHVRKAEANLSSKFADQQQSLQRALYFLKQNNESTETRRPLAAAALGDEEDIRCHMQEWFIPLKLEVLAIESLQVLELLRQQLYRHEKELWVSSVTALGPTCDAMLDKVSRDWSFDVTLGNAGSIFSAEKKGLTFVNLLHGRDMRIRITFRSTHYDTPMFQVDVDCFKTLGNSSFPFTKIAVMALRRAPERHRLWEEWQSKCDACSEINISHFNAMFVVEQAKLSEGGFIKDGELKLRIRFE